MKRRGVDSSMLASVGYEADAKRLEVEFQSGEVYVFNQVPPEVFEGLMRAESKGRYMNAVVIDSFPSQHVRGRGRLG